MFKALTFYNLKAVAFKIVSGLYKDLAFKLCRRYHSKYNSDARPLPSGHTICPIIAVKLLSIKITSLKLTLHKSSLHITDNDNQEEPHQLIWKKI